MEIRQCRENRFVLIVKHLCQNHSGGKLRKPVLNIVAVWNNCSDHTRRLSFLKLSKTLEKKVALTLKAWHCYCLEASGTIDLSKVPTKNCFSLGGQNLRGRSVGVMWIRISDPGSLRSWYIIGTDECLRCTMIRVILDH